MKLLSEVIQQDHHQMFTNPAWERLGYGRVQYTTAGKLAQDTNTEFDTFGHDANSTYMPNNKHIYDILNTLAIMIMDQEFDHNYDNNQNLFSDQPDDNFLKNKGRVPGHPGRPADYMPGEDVERYRLNNGQQQMPVREQQEPILEPILEPIKESVQLYEVGQIVEAKISFRGLQKTVRVFYPSVKGITRQQVQEDLNKVFPSTVVLTVQTMSGGSGRLKDKPLVICEGKVLVEGEVVRPYGNRAFPTRKPSPKQPGSVHYINPGSIPEGPPPADVDKETSALYHWTNMQRQGMAYDVIKPKIENYRAHRDSGLNDREAALKAFGSDYKQNLVPEGTTNAAINTLIEAISDSVSFNPIVANFVKQYNILLQRGVSKQYALEEAKAHLEKICSQNYLYSNGIVYDQRTIAATKQNAIKLIESFKQNVPEIVPVVEKEIPNQLFFFTECVESNQNTDTPHIVSEYVEDKYQKVLQKLSERLIQ